MKLAIRLLVALFACLIIAVVVQRCASAAAVGDPIEDSYTVGSFMRQVLYPAMARPEFARNPAAVLHTLKEVTLDGGTRIHYRTFAITISPSRTVLAAYGPFAHTTEAGLRHTIVLLLPDGQVIWQPQDPPPPAR